MYQIDLIALLSSKLPYCETVEMIVAMIKKSTV